MRMNELINIHLETTDDISMYLDDICFSPHTWEIRYLIVRPKTVFACYRAVLPAKHVQPVFFPQEKCPVLPLNIEKLKDSPCLYLNEDLTDKFVNWHDTMPCWVFADCCHDALRTSESVQQKTGEHDLIAVRDVLNYAVYDAEEAIGTVGDITFDPRELRIQELVIRTGHWYHHEELLLPVTSVTSISLNEKRILAAAPR